ncbi:MAG: hypothetical protein FWE14_09280 [Lachnospiraceae bacterium]|nr:hypothetical protein [Lachnospiraceae bacterium]
MSRWEFMRKLEELLSEISPGEREEALKYYNDYINDGGKENEAEVLESLGTPEQVAAIIKDGLEGNAGEFTESGFQSKAAQNANPVAHYQAPKSYDTNKASSQAKSGMSGGAIAVIVILCIIFSPVIIALCCALFGIMIAIFAVLFALLLSFGITSFALLISGIILVFVGLFRIFFGPLTGLAMVAAGLILSGVGLLFLLLTAFIVMKAIPGLFKGIGYLFDSLFGGKRGVKNG